MRWKIFTLIASLVLMVTTSAPPSKVEAQGLVEYALILVLVAIGPEERLELYLPSSNVPLPPTLDPQLVISIQASGVPICPSQTVQFTVPTTPGPIKILNVYRDGDHLMINGEEVEELSDCNKDAQRVVLTLSEPIPPSMADRIAADPTTVPAGFPHLQELGYSIYDSQTGVTRAEQWLGSRVIASQKAGVYLP